eukprot:6609643-Prymnesium_polylepis.1
MQILCCLPISKPTAAALSAAAAAAPRARRSQRGHSVRAPHPRAIPELCTDTALSCLSCCHCSLKL